MVGASPSALAAVGELAASLTSLLNRFSSGGSGAAAIGVSLLSDAGVRGAAGGVVAALLSPSCRVPRTWMAGLLSSVGSAVAQDPSSTVATTAAGVGAAAVLGDATNTAAGGRPKLVGPSRKRRTRGAKDTAVEGEVGGDPGEGQPPSQQLEEEEAAGGEATAAGEPAADTSAKVEGMSRALLASQPLVPLLLAPVKPTGPMQV